MACVPAKLLAITLTLTMFLAMFAILSPRLAFSVDVLVLDDYCWIEGVSLDMGFSKYGEMIGYNEDTEMGLGLQYSGYARANNTYDQRLGTSVDPFCNEEIGVDWWMNGWFIDIKYRTPAGVFREIWAFAMFSDGQQYGGDWIVMPSVAGDSSARPLWQEYPPYANPDSTAYEGIVDPLPQSGGRKTNGICETEPIEIIYNGPRRFIAVTKTTISDVGGGQDLVDLTFTFIFNKAEKNVIVLQDFERLYKKQHMNIQFGNREQWDLGISPNTDSYAHWYTAEPVQYWDTDQDGTINATEVETTFENYTAYFLENKHPAKWWDEVPEYERPSQVCDEWTEEMIDFPETWLEAREIYYHEPHMDDTIKEDSFAVAQVISQAGDYVGAVAVWPHPEFWSASNVYYPPYRTTVAGGGNNPSAISLMLVPMSRMLEWHKWTYDEDPYQTGEEEGIEDRDNIWVKADDVRDPYSSSTLEPRIPFIIYEHDFKLSSAMPEYRIELVHVLADRHDADDEDAQLGDNSEEWSSGLNVIDREIQDQLHEVFNAHASPPYSWPMFRHNLRNTGYSESPGPNTNKTLWNYTIGPPVLSSPAVTDDKVFVQSACGKIYCLDAYNGTQIWNNTQQRGKLTRSSPAVADGKVYVGSYYPPKGNVSCFDATTGVLIWNYTIMGAAVMSSPAVAYGRVYVGATDSNVYCLDASTGEKIWNYTTGGMVFSSPAVADGKVYVGSDDNKTYCLDASTGALIWNYTTGGKVVSSSAVAYGKVYVGSYDSNVYCLDASTGEKIWNYTTSGSVYSSPAVAYGKVYVGSYDSNVYCLDASTGEKIWNYTTGGMVFSSPAVADGKVYVGSHDHKVYCLNASTGAHLWSHTIGGDVYSSPAVADGIVFVGSFSGVVYVIGSIIRVPEDYASMQEAIDAAESGDTIIIGPGTYNESLVIDKPITIIGQRGSATEFEGGGSGIAVTLLSSASGSTIAGIVITNWDQGILIEDSSDCTIYDNIMTLMGVSGIALEGDNAFNNVIYNNIFHDNAVAINLTTSSTSNIIYSNTISENTVGIDMSTSNNNIIYHNNFVVNTLQVNISTSTGNIWHNGYPSGGNYWSDYTGSDEKNGPDQDELGSDGIGDIEYIVAVNNIDRYPLVKPFSGIGITNVITSKTIIGQGYDLHITVTILNYGYSVEGEISTVTIYANTIIIATQAIILKSRNSTTVTFTWSTAGVAKGNYIITAEATPILYETDTVDNTRTAGDIVIVTIPGDVDGNGHVFLYDAVMVCGRYGARRGDPRYDANCDMNDNGQIFLYDAVIVGAHYGQKDC